MKKAIPFSRLFVPLSCVSALLIASGIVAVCTRGINLGLDFEPGLLEEVRIAPTAFDLSYSGGARATVQTGKAGVSLIISGAGAENETRSFPFAEYATAKNLADALGRAEGVSVTFYAPPDVPASALFTDASVSTALSAAPYRFHYGEESSFVTAERVREALAGGGVNAETKAAGEAGSFQIRAADTGEAGGNRVLQETIAASLRAAFGEDRVAVTKTDFIGAQFSRSLALKSLFTVLASIALIWGYSAIRFKWDFALAAVVAIIHDALIMLTFVAWAQVEFATIILAAVLTVIGYSINATIVVLDRVRKDVKTVRADKFTELLDLAQTEMLSRSILTTLTTLLVVLALFFVTTGNMKDFALTLSVGLVSGAYSSIFITGSVIAFTRRNWKPTLPAAAPLKPSSVARFPAADVRV
ncbi:protein translocase subunit SecF [Treponema endosymbiont of Eucomonympha sp.]|uniref:protein translocase subunit SecF n=1 Tax=Treponema endosymbiont of Eucomonympha sp. TaxID=1580831 RepID=UPI000A3F649D|nr:protein translocase subunit SecF [Treponema endosymbiont of Eucomonympha sp.]